MNDFYHYFSELNRIPRLSHHEERVADYLCAFAQEHGLDYDRDERNCVVIRKPATPGHEQAAPVVILNHMDMVCVAADDYMRDGRLFNPDTDEIRPYIEEVKNPDGTVSRWMKAEGTSLGADNGIGLSMALAILADPDLVHPALEVLTTTNEEDGMSGAEGLGPDFIRGRQVINLDSEAYDEITIGAAGAYLQVGHWAPQWKPVPENLEFYRISLTGGLGGHSGVDINKGRCNCIRELSSLFGIANLYHVFDGVYVCSMNGGTANAAIPSWAEVTVALTSDHLPAMYGLVSAWEQSIRNQYGKSDPGVRFHVESVAPLPNYLENANQVIRCLDNMYNICGPLWMRPDMRNTVMTSNNIGVVRTTDTDISVSCHSRSFSNDEMHKLAHRLCEIFEEKGARVECLMDTGSWMEREDSPLLELTCNTFYDVLGFEPRRVAMHFVLEAAHFVEKYPGIEIASIGPRILEPHSTSERIDLDTADNIWRVTVELLRRLA